MKTQNGIVWLPLLIMVAAVAAFGTTAAVVYKANKPLSEKANTTSSAPTTDDTNTSATALSNTDAAVNSDTNSPVDTEVVTTTNTTKNTNGIVLADAVEIYQDARFIGFKNKKAVDTQIVTANIATEGASANVAITHFRASGITFKFRIQDPMGVEGLGVIGYGPDVWGFFNDTSAYYAPHRISGDQYDGEYLLVSTQFNGHTLLNVDTDRGFFIAWRRAEATSEDGGEEYLYVGANNTLYKSAAEAQEHTMLFASVNTDPEPVMPDEVSVSIEDAIFSTTSITFRFHLEDPEGVTGLSVRSLGNDWDPYWDAHGSQRPKLLSGNQYNGTYELVATQLYGSPLSVVDSSKGFYLVWERNKTGLDREFFHVGKNNIIYRQYAEVQQTPIPFAGSE